MSGEGCLWMLGSPEENSTQPPASATNQQEASSPTAQDTPAERPPTPLLETGQAPGRVQGCWDLHQGRKPQAGQGEGEDTHTGHRASCLEGSSHLSAKLPGWHRWSPGRHGQPCLKAQQGRWHSGRECGHADQYPSVLSWPLTLATLLSHHTAPEEPRPGRVRVSLQQRRSSQPALLPHPPWPSAGTLADPKRPPPGGSARFRTHMSTPPPNFPSS